MKRPASPDVRQDKSQDRSQDEPQDGSKSHRVRRSLGTTATLAWQSLVVLLAAGVIGYVLGLMWGAVLPIILALLASSLVWPIAAFLRKHRWPPALAAATVTLSLVVLLIGAITLIVIPVASQAEDVADGVVGGLESVQKWAQGPPLNLGDDQIGNVIDEALNKLQNSAGDLAGIVFGSIGSIGGSLVTTALVLILLFFFLKDGPKFVPWVAKQSGGRAAPHIVTLMQRGYGVLSGFMRSQTLVGLIDAVFIGVGLLIVGVPLVLPLAVLTFIGAFIPIIGAFVAGAFAVLIALVSNGLTEAIIVLVIVLVVQQLEGNVFAPLLQSKSLALHPAVVILAVIVGSGLAGITGALLSVPIAALIAVIWRYVQEQLNGEAADSEQPDDVTEPAPVKTD